MINKKLAFIAIPVIAAIMISAVASTQLAIADPKGKGKSAMFIRDFGCFVFDGEGDGFFTNDPTLSIETHGSTTVITCMAETGVPTPDGKSDVRKGFRCGTILGLTTDSKSTVTPNGHSTLVCRVNNAAQNP